MDNRQNTTAAEYDKAIQNSSLSQDDFLVERRTITKMYANTIASKAANGKDGNYVLIELSPNDAVLLLLLSSFFFRLKFLTLFF